MRYVPVVVRGYRLDVNEQTVISILANFGPMAPHAVAECMQVEPPTATQIENAMKRIRDIIRNVPGVIEATGTQRRRLLTLTPAGHELAEQVHRSWEAQWATPVTHPPDSEAP